MKECGAGKGDRYRNVNQKKYDENWEKIFGKENNHKKKKGDLKNECKNCKIK
tara:strand:+ start:188 stop:343 length:156 start_codon:yes stop_codon:yes gene_type:complete